MARKKRLSQAEAPVPGTVLTVLDDDALVELLQAAKTAKVLASLASSSRQLCRLARSRVPVKLRIASQRQAALVLRSQARGGCRPFSSCVELSIFAEDTASSFLVSGILNAAQQWPVLEQLDVFLSQDLADLDDGLPLDPITSSALGGVSALQHLQRLFLNVSEFGVCSAAHVCCLKQLTQLQLTARHPDAAAADLTALSVMTTLVELQLEGPPAVHPAATAPAAAPAPAAAGAFCLPSSLVTLRISSYAADDLEVDREAPASGMAYWLTHLAGCPRLQHLTLQYGEQQHASAHPSALVPRLAQHNRQLRSLHLDAEYDVRWSYAVEGLAGAVAGPFVVDWRPDAALASLTGLECLVTNSMLVIAEESDWQHVACLTALTKLKGAYITAAPTQGAGARLTLLHLGCSDICLDGYELGVQLLACPVLQRANVDIQHPFAPPPEPPADRRLHRHPTLQKLTIHNSGVWDLPIYSGEAGGAARHFANLAPVLQGLSHLSLEQWPQRNSTAAELVLPDLSQCTALTRLKIGFWDRGGAGAPPEQEDFLSMLRPLQQLQQLQVMAAPGLNARAVLTLQSMLPCLESVMLEQCGKLLPVAAGGAQQQQGQGQQLLAKVKQLLRPGLVLTVC